MQYHSIEHLERKNEFCRVLLVACHDATQVLIVTPDKMDSLEDYFKLAFNDKAAKELRNKKSLKINENLTIFFEGKDKDSGFKKENIFAPWASINTIYNVIKDPRAVNTFYIPHSGENSGPGTKDELKLYLENYPKSKAV